MGNPGPGGALLWALRRSEGDVARMYGYLSDLMRLAAGGDMLNFGLWEAGDAPADAQARLCSEFGRAAGLAPGQDVVDAGSGYGAPAAAWQGEFGPLRVTCVNTARGQLRGTAAPGAGLACATATALPLAAGTADRVLAFESAQHFRPLGRFASEAHRVLRPGGVLAVALPVLGGAAAAGARLGLLSLTWASEHYTRGRVMGAVGGLFEAESEEMVGGRVYGPLAAYYAANRPRIEALARERYPWYVVRALSASMPRMAAASRKGVIDYMVATFRRRGG